ncbi:hypothetical protein Bbelb_232560 [Branchiostoma belcheri]|nr:hypothetical protein Bbelb_232560 [Branchiostoma belcheri]
MIDGKVKPDPVPAGCGYRVVYGEIQDVTWKMWEQIMFVIQVCLISGYSAFNGICYKNFAEQKTYEEARQRCAEDGGLLAMPKDSAVNGFLGTLETGYTWVGLNDIDSEGQWVFEDGQSLASSGYSNWNSGAPDSGDGTMEEDCVVFQATSHTWNDAGCGGTRQFLCQQTDEGLYRSIGCWAESDPRAIPSLESTDPRLDGDYQTRANAVEKCYWVARERGYHLFAVLDGGQCASTATAIETYKQYGASSDCAGDGRGASGANDVYEIFSDKRCPDGYTPYGAFCYKVFPDQVTHANAQALCTSQGGHLAMPKYNAINQLVIYLLKREAAQGYWFGLQRVPGTSSFKWDDGTDLGSFDHWGSGQPNGGDCVKYKDIQSRKWYDSPCSGTRGSICQVPAECLETRNALRPWAKIGSRECDEDRECDDDILSGDKCLQQATEQARLSMTLGRRVKVVLESSSGDVTLIFDGRNTDKYSWFSQSRLISSPWTDLDTETVAAFSVYDRTVKRSFFISRNYADCDSTRGWLSVSDPVCSFEMATEQDPVILYSATSTNVLWNAGDSTIGIADRMVIYVSLDKHCPDGYIQFAEACYKVFEKKKTYQDAKTHCSNEGGHLAMPKDSATDSLLYYLRNQKLPGQIYYVGLTLVGGTWKWEDGSDLAGYSGWHPGEPNGYPIETCVALYYFQSQNEQWVDITCSDTHGFVCQVPASDWQQVFATVPGTGQTVYDAWNASSDTAVLHYKSSLVDLWTSLGITKVMVVLESSSAHVKLVFNGQNTDKYSWFSQSRLISSPWTDLDTEPVAAFSILDEASPEFSPRSFVIIRSRIDCASASGWLMVGDGGLSATCPFERTLSDSVPSILYSTNTSNNVVWSSGCPVADYVRFNDICYKSFSDLKTYAEAEVECAADGGILAVPKDNATNSFIHSLQEVSGSWIGVSDTDNDGQWVFADGQTVTSSGYSNWSPGEPLATNNRGCVIFEGEGFWDEKACTKDDYGFICQLNEELLKAEATVRSADRMVIYVMTDTTSKIMMWATVALRCFTVRRGS